MGAISNFACSTSHLQLNQDLMMLKLDQCDGHIIEFPLRSVSKVYRMIKYGNRWRRHNTFSPASRKMRELAEEVVIIEFNNKSIAFVFPTLQESLNFSICFSLLVKRARQRPKHREIDIIQCGPL